MVKNPPCNAGDVGSIPGWGTNISHTTDKEKAKPAHYNPWTHSQQLESQYVSTKDPTWWHKDLACHN